jgi:S1-C subfamily serine protease
MTPTNSPSSSSLWATDSPQSDVPEVLRDQRSNANVPHRPTPLGSTGSRPPGKDRRRFLVAAGSAGLISAVVAGLVAYGTVRLTDHESSSTTLVASSASSVTTVPLAESSSITVAPSTSGRAPAAPALSSRPFEIQTILAAVEPSVVSIEIGQQSATGPIQPVAAGSGVVISNDGLVLTNAHVVDLTDQLGRPLDNPVVAIKLMNGTVRNATVLGKSPANDIALIQVKNTSGLRAATLGSSAQLKVGDDVIAIGNALDLGATPTVTKGIVSAVDRSLDIDANTQLTGLIQTDASINHGNSGGALVNAKGEVIGINSAGIPDAQNVGFAIAIDTIKPLLPQLRKGGTITNNQSVAFLGIGSQQTADGVTITGVASGSAADKAGLLPGDVIFKIDTTAIATTTELGSTLRKHKPGDTIAISISRNGTTRTVVARLGSRDQ